MGLRKYEEVDLHIEQEVKKEQKMKDQNKKKKSGILTKGEKILYKAGMVIGAIFLFSSSVNMLDSQGKMQKLTIETQEIEMEIAKMQIENKGLENQIQETLRMENVSSIVESKGMKYNSENIKTISK